MRGIGKRLRSLSVYRSRNRLFQEVRGSCILNSCRNFSAPGPNANLSPLQGSHLCDIAHAIVQHEWCMESHKCADFFLSLAYLTLLSRVFLGVDCMEDQLQRDKRGGSVL